MAKLKLVCKSNDGLVLFNTEEAWFNYISFDSGNTYPIMMYRPGNFDITGEEAEGIKKWLRENLKDGVFQS